MTTPPTDTAIREAVEGLRASADDFHDFPPLAQPADIRTVLAALEAAQKDSERLDWLEASTALLSYPPLANCGINPKGRFHVNDNDIHFYDTSYRAAIDAAIASTAGKEQLP